jgi:23S rRNA (adenine1618-N6)-methyltransferase
MTTQKIHLHPRNKHKGRYDFALLTKCFPKLKVYLKRNQYNDESIDFANPDAVKTLNHALLVAYYNIAGWDIPESYLCPPIPGRADYIHHAADLLADRDAKPTFTQQHIRFLDIGVGANCIYPLLAVYEYGWSGVGTDIDSVALQSAAKIIAANSLLKQNVELRLQVNKNVIFKGVIFESDQFDLVICNPPFHKSANAAQAANQLKNKNLQLKTSNQNSLNFGGQANELWCDGGELSFVKRMIRESKLFSSQCKWFTSLVSQSKNLDLLYQELIFVSAKEIKTIAMGQGNKVSRMLAWCY